MSSLLDLFESVEVSEQDFLTDSDVTFLKALEKDFQLVHKQLADSRQVVGGVSGEFPYFSSITDQDFKHHQFVAKRFIAEIDNSIKRVKELFACKVVEYLNEKYHLKLTADGLTQFNTYAEIISVLLQRTGIGFKQKGIQDTIKAMTNHLGGRYNPTLKGKTVTLPSFNLKSFEWQIIYKWNDAYKALIKFCNYFETGLLAENTVIDKHFNEETVKEYKKYDIPGNKINGFTIYKNNRLDIHFQNAEEALDFYTTLKNNL